MVLGTGHGAIGPRSWTLGGHMTRRSSAAHSLRRRLARDDRGASAVEYGLMLAAIAVVIVAVVWGFGGFVNETFEDSHACLSYTGVGEPDC
jgi:Flp pilus assembly pilin Flp